MSKERNIHLTDEQYLELLKRARKHLDSVKKVESDDCTMPGNKYTDTNVGLCNDFLTTLDIAMWPDEFPHSRRTMKYRGTHHKCPLDTRPRTRKSQNGCFYTCRIFKGGLKDLKTIKKLYDELRGEI